MKKSCYVIFSYLCACLIGPRIFVLQNITHINKHNDIQHQIGPGFEKVKKEIPAMSRRILPADSMEYSSYWLNGIESVNFEKEETWRDA